MSSDSNASHALLLAAAIASKRTVRLRIRVVDHCIELLSCEPSAFVTPDVVTVLVRGDGALATRPREIHLHQIDAISALDCSSVDAS